MAAASCIPALFRRRAAKLQAKLHSDRNAKREQQNEQQKEMESSGRKSGRESPSNKNFLMFMELRKKIMIFRDIFDIPPLNGSIPIHELLIMTGEDLHRMYPEFVNSVPTEKLKERNIHEGLICFYEVLKCVGDSAWIEDPMVRDKFMYGDVENVPMEELAKAVVAILDCINRIAKERFNSMEEDEPKRDYSQSISIDRRSVDQCSEWKYPYSACTSPQTPTSVLPESPKYEEQSVSYSPPRLWDLRAQALERLSPMDWKRLSFHMILQNQMQNQNISDSLKANAEGKVYIPGLSENGQAGKDEVKLEEVESGPTPMITDNDDQKESVQSPSSASKMSVSPRSPTSPTTPITATAMSSFPPIKQVHSPPPQPTSPNAPSSLKLPPPPPPPLPKTSSTPQAPSDSIVPSPSSSNRPSPPPSPPNQAASQPPSPGVAPTPSSPPIEKAPPPPPPSSEASSPTPPHGATSPPPPPPISGPASPHKEATPAPIAATPPLPPRPSTAAPPPAAVAPPPPPPPGAAPPPPPPSGGAAPPPPPPPGGAPAAPPPMPGKGGAPPPPPPGSKVLRAKNTTKLKRSSHMGNLYRLLKGKVEGSCFPGKTSQAKKAAASTNKTNAGGGQSMADALAEMTKRSSYFQQIEEDVEKHAQAIKEMQGNLAKFQTKDMKELLDFYHQVESKLEVLTDESQIFQRFEGFPVKKLEALRMAAALYKKLDGILTELQNWKIESPLDQLLDKAEKYFNKIKGELEALERTKDEESKKFQSHNIHFDFQILVKIKEAMVDVSSSCMELALKERRDAYAASNDQIWSTTGGQKKVCAKMLWRAFQFAFKVYSFAGGQDERADTLTRELAQEIETDPMQD